MGQGTSTRPILSDPGRLGESQPLSTDSNISVEELLIDTSKQHMGPTHRTVNNQEQARHFQQDLARIQVRFQDFGEVRVQDSREVRIQDRNLDCEGATKSSSLNTKSSSETPYPQG